MAGTYIEGVSKVLSGVYTLIKTAAQRATLGPRGVVAYPFTSNWGPVNELTPVLFGGEFNKLFNGENTDLTANKVATHAWKGSPQKLLGYRMATGTAAKGLCTIPGATGTALELETLYPSDRAFKAVVKDGVIAGSKVVEIIEGSTKLVSADGEDIDTIAAKLDESDYVRVKTKGAELPSDTAGIDFTGGNNGSAVTATEYSAFLDVIEADGTANTFSLDGTTDEAILLTAETWTKRVRNEGIYITFVRGGAYASLSEANTKSKDLNHRAVINVGNGCDGYTAADMAIFIAARVASIALNRTVTDEVVDYTAVNKTLKPAERVTAKESGTLIFVQKGDFVEIDEGVNTLTAPGSDERKEMGKIRVNNTIDFITRDLEAFGDEYKKDRSNTQEARETYAATIENDYFRPLAAMEVVRDDYFFIPDPEYHGDDAVFNPKIDEAFFATGYAPIDSMERIYHKATVNF